MVILEPCIGPSKFTIKTCPIFYVTRVLFTADWIGLQLLQKAQNLHRITDKNVDVNHYYPKHLPEKNINVNQPILF